MKKENILSLVMVPVEGTVSFGVVTKVSEISRIQGSVGNRVIDNIVTTEVTVFDDPEADGRVVTYDEGQVMILDHKKIPQQLLDTPAGVSLSRAVGFKKALDQESVPF